MEVGVASFILPEKGIFGFTVLGYGVLCMILPEKTKREFGYYPDELSNGSHKKIWVRCDYCQTEITKAKKSWTVSNNIIDKDACSKCKTKKGKEVLIKEFGVENVFQLKSVKEKSKETVREKYGCDYHTQSENFKIKSKQTQIEKYGSEELRSKAIADRNKANMQEKYGVDNPSQIPEFRDKAKQTNLERYGNENYLITADCKEKTVSSNLERYGVENVFASEEIKQKIRETNLEKYGVEYPQLNTEIREKTKQVILEKYGCEYVGQNEEVKEKIRETNIEKYGTPYATQSEIVKAKTKATAIKNGNITVINGKTMKDIAAEMGKPYTTFTSQLRMYGLETALKNQTSGTIIENIVEDLLKKNNINYSKHGIINGRKTDFILLDHKIVIECDGLYWHCDLILDKQYHHKKRLDYLKAGYTSLFFREDEIHNKLDVIESIILNKCGKSNKVYARKCDIVKLTTKQAKSFFKENHLMGSGRGIPYALTIDGNTFSCILIRRTKDKEYEISRFCHKKGYNVIGGFSKLLKFVENDLDMTQLITFIDFRYGLGDYLPKFGFNYSKAYLSFRWTSSGSTHHRLKYPGSSGYDLGLAKIWDCGQAKYVKNYT